MPSVLVKHSVKDFASWKKVFDEHGKTRESFGSKGGKVFQAADNPNEVTVLLHWDSVANAKKFVESSDLRSIMAKAGVVSEPMVVFLESETTVPK